MTTAFSPIAVAAALTAAEEYRGGDRNWRGSTRQHNHWLMMLPEYQAAYRNYYAKQVSGHAAPTADELNRILAENGFDITLQAWPVSPGNFGVIGISDIAVSWRQTGKLSTVWRESDGETFPGFELDADANGREVRLDCFGPDVKVAELDTADGQRVRLAELPGPADWLDLTNSARQLWRGSATPAQWQPELFIFPMVSLDVQPNIDWMIGIANDTFRIEQAVAQTKFGMNQYGARAKEAVGFGLESMPSAFRITKPFVITIGHPEASVPGFQAYITEEHWVDPGDLSAM